MLKLAKHSTLLSYHILARRIASFFYYISYKMDMSVCSKPPPPPPEFFLDEVKLGFANISEDFFDNKNVRRHQRILNAWDKRCVEFT